MGDWLFGWVYDLLYILQKSICYILDFIKEIFSKLAGIETVEIGGQQEDLLSHFLLSDGVRNAFLGVFLVGVILLFVFVIIAVIKSEAADPQHKKTKGQILVKAVQSFVMFLLIPFLLLAGIMLTNAVVGAINGSMSGAMLDGNANTLIGGQILVTSGNEAYIGDPAARAEIERMFITGQLDYNSLSVVKQYYHLGDMNFFVGIAGGLVILIMFVMSAIMFVQRIFDIILLYVVSPASVSTIPLDDGGRFKIWREMLVSKVLGAYGIILSMNLFFLIIPQVSQIAFFGNSFKDGVVRLLFVLGGAFAITKANMVISQLTGSNAGAQEAQQMLSNIHTGISMVRSVGRAASGAAGLVIGGTDFLKNRKHGASFSESVSSAIHSQRNRREDKSDDGGKDDPKNPGGGSGGGSGGFGGSGGPGGNTSASNTVKEAANEQTGSPANANARSANGTAAANEETPQGGDCSSIVSQAATAEETAQEMQGGESGNTVTETAESGRHGKGFGSAVKGATRLATLPAGILKDLIQGGVITAGKNFGPRVRNVLSGSSVINHAVVKSPAAKATQKTIERLAENAAKEDKK